jgi:CHAT domain-containing protein
MTAGRRRSFRKAGLDLSSARLLVLSACDTGTGLHKRGQEIQGLRWGFRAAGAKAMVTSLWRSNDAVTRRLMHRFYEVLAGGASSPDLFRGADALRFAQLERILSEQRLGIRKPLHWSNFVFSGIY